MDNHLTINPLLKRRKSKEPNAKNGEFKIRWPEKHAHYNTRKYSSHKTIKTNHIQLTSNSANT